MPPQYRENLKRTLAEDQSESAKNHTNSLKVGAQPVSSNHHNETFLQSSSLVVPRSNGRANKNN